MLLASHIRPLLHYLRLDGLRRRPRLRDRVRFVTIYVKLLIEAIGAFCQRSFLYKSIDCLAVDSRNYGKRWKSVVKRHQKVVKVGSEN